jgi:hypothetical protein
VELGKTHSVVNLSLIQRLPGMIGKKTRRLLDLLRRGGKTSSFYNTAVTIYLQAASMSIGQFQWNTSHRVKFP